MIRPTSSIGDSASWMMKYGAPTFTANRRSNAYWDTLCAGGTA